ncbi:hypothetical protein GGH96_004427 [Coemansia sp. RSA 1972]|nr:hypothetical protein GGH96_004427 [Coemansia sp. RSA 1972]
MDTTLTYFRKSAFSRDVLVYTGDLDSQPAEGTQPYPVYYLDVGSRHINLCQNATQLTSPLLAGKQHGMLGRTATIRGDFISTAHRNGAFSNAWTFVYMAEEFKWGIARWSNRWTLVDGRGNNVAVFERASFRASKIGTLSIPAGPPEHLVWLVVLTCELVHRTIKSSERAAHSS